MVFKVDFEKKKKQKIWFLGLPNSYYDHFGFWSCVVKLDKGLLSFARASILINGWVCRWDGSSWGWSFILFCFLLLCISLCVYIEAGMDLGEKPLPQSGDQSSTKWQATQWRNMATEWQSINHKPMILGVSMYLSIRFYIVGPFSSLHHI